MRVKLTTPTENLIVGEIYRVAVIHAEGYELRGSKERYPVENFEVVIEEEEEENDD